MPKRMIPAFDSSIHTKRRILDTAASLFAMKGFRGVSLDEISKSVGIKTASIYYHYEDKDALIMDALTRFEKSYSEYLEWLDAENEEAESLESVLDNMFNEEFQEKRNPIAVLGMSMTLKEQHDHPYARQCALDKVFQGSIEVLQSHFDRMVEADKIPPSDTQTLATLLMLFITSVNALQVHEYMGTKLPFDLTKTLSGMKRLLAVALEQGILSPDPA